MTEAHIKEDISMAYVKQISAYAGMSCDKVERDYGIDGCINDQEYSADRKRHWQTGFRIDFQLKATVNAKPKDGIILYDLAVKNYRDLINTSIGTSRILILYIMPKEMTEWLDFTERETCLRKRAVWCSLRGLPDTNNKKTVRIEIPEKQWLTSEEIIRMMAIVKGGGWL